MPLTVKWGLLVVLTVLASPHLLTYDLILLTIPLLVFADWAVAARSIPCSRGLAGCSCFFIWRRSAAISCGWFPVQLSVVVMVALVWMLIRGPRSVVRSRRSAVSGPQSVELGYERHVARRTRNAPGTST